MLEHVEEVDIPAVLHLFNKSLINSSLQYLLVTMIVSVFVSMKLILHMLQRKMRSGGLKRLKKMDLN